MSVAISVQSVSKRYRIRTTDRTAMYRTLRDDLANLAGAPMRLLTRRSLSPREDFWALKDVSFDVQPGDVVGIIGRNGAGKSTLLKILSRITRPTEGCVRLRGRVASLLEVGTGFHPELTGRENIFLSGAVLGMKHVEIRRRFDEIVAFAEVERFLDTPVKHYSSGMYVRLGFAVAAHLESEILIIDEVLAVGDAIFQKKCLGKMEDVASGGRTVLFVSHNMTAVKSLCQTALLIDAGQLKGCGAARTVADDYLQTAIHDANLSRTWQLENAPGSGPIKLLAIKAEPLEGDRIDVESGVKISWRFRVVEPTHFVGTTIEVRTIDGAVVLHEGVDLNGESESCGDFESEQVFPGELLNAGKYRVSLIFGARRTHLLYYCDEALTFEIKPLEEGGDVRPPCGVLFPQSRLRVGAVR